MGQPAVGIPDSFFQFKTYEWICNCAQVYRFQSAPGKTWTLICHNPTGCGKVEEVILWRTGDIDNIKRID